MTVSEAPAPKALPGVLVLTKETVAFLTKNSSLIFGYAGWLLIPVIIILVSSFLDPAVGDLIDIVGGIMLIALTLWAGAAIRLSITMLKRPELFPNDIKGSVSEIAWRRAPTLLWIVVLSGVLEFFGLLLFVLPGILLMIWLTFAETEATLSGSGTFAALKASRERVRGYFLPVLYRLIAFTAIVCLLFSLLVVPLMVAAGITDYTAIFVNPPAWLSAVFNGLQIILLPLSICYELHLYFALRTP